MSDNVIGLPGRGKTYLTGPNRTAASTGTTSKAIEGIKKTFKDLDYSSTTGVYAPRTGGYCRCVLVRNGMGRTALPKMAVTWANGKVGKEVDGFTVVESGPGVAGIVDEWLPAAGAAANDLFWIVTNGPSRCINAASASTIVHKAWVAAITAAASTTSTTAGRIVAVAATSESTTTLSHALNRIGQAMSTTATPGADVLVYVDLPVS